MPAEALQAGRYATGLSQNAFAAELGLSPKTVNDVENGFKKPHGNTLRSMREECERRGVRFVELPDGVGVISLRRHDPAEAPRTAVPTRIAASRRKASGA